MLSCLIMLLVWVIVAAICWIVIKEVLAVFWSPPAPIMHLVGLLLGLLVLIQALACLGLIEGPFPHRL